MPGKLHGVNPFWDFQFARPEKSIISQREESTGWAVSSNNIRHGGNRIHSTCMYHVMCIYYYVGTCVKAELAAPYLQPCCFSQ